MMGNINTWILALHVWGQSAECHLVSELPQPDAVFTIPPSLWWHPPSVSLWPIHAICSPLKAGTFQRCPLQASHYLPLVPHICVSESGQHWFREWLDAYSAPSHYLNQCWVTVNWNLRNKLQWNFDQNTKLLIHKNASEDIVYEKAVIMSRGRTVYSQSVLVNPIAGGYILLTFTGLITLSLVFTTSIRSTLRAQTSATPNLRNVKQSDHGFLFHWLFTQTLYFMKAMFRINMLK